MKILFLTQSMSFGGAERVMSILANEFAESGHNVMIALSDYKGQIAYELHNQVQLVRFYNNVRAKNVLSIIREIKSVRNSVRIFSPDVIITFAGIEFVFAKAATLFNGIPIVFSQRNDPFSKIRKESRMDDIAVRLADLAVFQTNGAKNYYKTNGHGRKSVILNPIDTSKFGPVTYNVLSNTIYSVGRLVAQKNQLLLIRAFSKVLINHPEMILIIYGEGPLREVLLNEIKALNLESKVLLPGNTDNVNKQIANGRAFVLSSNYEGLPNALIEAMVIGLPCVSTDCSPGGARELIDDGVNGFIVPCEDVEKLAEKISTLLSRPELAQSFSEKGSAIRNRVSSRKIANIWIDEINKIIKI